MSTILSLFTLVYFSIYDLICLHTSITVIKERHNYNRPSITFQLQKK